MSQIFYLSTLRTTENPTGDIDFRIRLSNYILPTAKYEQFKTLLHFHPHKLDQVEMSKHYARSQA